MYTVVSLTKKECLSGGNCSYIVRLSVRDLHGPTIIISDSSQDTIIISEPCDLDDHRSATSGNYALLNIFLLLKLFNFLTKL